MSIGTRLDGRSGDGKEGDVPALVLRSDTREKKSKGRERGQGGALVAALPPAPSYDPFKRKSIDTIPFVSIVHAGPRGHPGRPPGDSVDGRDRKTRIVPTTCRWISNHANKFVFPLIVWQLVVLIKNRKPVGGEISILSLDDGTHPLSVFCQDSFLLALDTEKRVPSDEKSLPVVVKIPSYYCLVIGRVTSNSSLEVDQLRALQDPNELTLHYLSVIRHHLRHPQFYATHPVAMSTLVSSPDRPSSIVSLSSVSFSSPPDLHKKARGVVMKSGCHWNLEHIHRDMLSVLNKDRARSLSLNEMVEELRKSATYYESDPRIPFVVRHQLDVLEKSGTVHGHILSSSDLKRWSMVPS